MKNVLKLCCFLVMIVQGMFLYAQNLQHLPDSFYLLRDTVYMQNTSTVQIVRLYTTAKEAIEQAFSGAALYTALSRCACLVGITFQVEKEKHEAAAWYVQGIAWAEDSLSIMPTSEGYQYLATNIALACGVKSRSWALANAGKIDHNAGKALALNPQNMAAQYVIAAKYIQAPWPLGNMQKGASLLQEIINQNIELLEKMEKEDIFNIYLAMAMVYEKEKKSNEADAWLDRALALYPTNRFKETLLRGSAH